MSSPSRGSASSPCGRSATTRARPRRRARAERRVELAWASCPRAEVTRGLVAETREHAAAREHRPARRHWAEWRSTAGARRGARAAGRVPRRDPWPPDFGPRDQRADAEERRHDHDREQHGVERQRGRSARRRRPGAYVVPGSLRLAAPGRWPARLRAERSRSAKSMPAALPRAGTGAEAGSRRSTRNRARSAAGR